MLQIRKPSLFFVLCSTFLHSALWAQVPLHTQKGSVDLEGFGANVGTMRDVNNDGHDDYFIATWPVPGTPGLLNNYVRLHSGRTGNVIREHKSGLVPKLGSAIASSGFDLDNDGVDDYILGESSGLCVTCGKAYFYSGQSGNLLGEISAAPGTGLGSAIAWLGNTDGNAYPDFAFGEPLAQGGDGAVLLSEYVGLNAINPTNFLPGSFGSQEKFGSSVARLGDVNGDGYDDLLVGAPESSFNNMTHRGRFAVISGRTGGTLYQAFGASAYEKLGSVVADLGDIDGDQIIDFAVSAPNFGSTSQQQYQNGRGRIDVYLSGMTNPNPNPFFLPTYAFSVQGKNDTELLGCSLAGIGDVDGDGTPDLAAGTKLGFFKIFSGKKSNNGMMLYTQYGGPLEPGPGRTVAGSYRNGGHDIDNDGFPDVVAGDNTGTGKAWVVSGHPGGSSTKFFGTSTPGCLGQNFLSLFFDESSSAIPSSAAGPSVSKDFYFISYNYISYSSPVPGKQALHPGLLLVSDKKLNPAFDQFGISIPFSIDVLGAGQIFAFDFPVGVTATGVPNSQGVATIKIPANTVSPATAGMTFYAQAFFGWPSNMCNTSGLGNLSSTQAIEFVLKP